MIFRVPMFAGIDFAFCFSHYLHTQKDHCLQCQPDNKAINAAALGPKFMEGLKGLWVIGY